jgi:hypothetical protein
MSIMNVNYDHSKNLHTIEGARAALPKIFTDIKPRSLLDVGCGFGTWLMAASEFGVQEILGLDGVVIPPDRLLIPQSQFQHQDLTHPWQLKRRFDAVLCLEVAEHLDETHAVTLMDAITKHTDLVVFSAACPGQPGQNHVNTQWPAYWQELFNHRGFACSDDARWRIWNDHRVEPWYRQNLFIATRDPAKAGKENRIVSVIHPEILGMLLDEWFKKIKMGSQNPGWYISIPLQALWHQLCCRMSRRNAYKAS